MSINPPYWKNQKTIHVLALLASRHVWFLVKNDYWKLCTLVGLAHNPNKCSTKDYIGLIITDQDLGFTKP
jgi:hypothetical protein